MNRNRTLAAVLGMLVAVLLAAADCNGDGGDGGPYGGSAPQPTWQDSAPAVP